MKHILIRAEPFSRCIVKSFFWENEQIINYKYECSSTVHLDKIVFQNKTIIH